MEMMTTFISQIKSYMSSCDPMSLELRFNDFIEPLTLVASDFPHLTDVELHLEDFCASSKKVNSSKVMKLVSKKSEEVTFLLILFFYRELFSISLDNLTIDQWQIMAKLFSRTAEDCKYMWFSLQLSKKQKFNWSPSEDEMLLNLVNSATYTNYGRIQWELIAKELNKQLHLLDPYIRLSKHCRERWVNHLNPEMKKDKWTVQEDLNLFEKYLDHPQKWSKISKVLKGRTDNSIKNRFNKLIKLDKLKSSLYDKKCDDDSFERLKKIFYQAKESIKIEPGNSNEEDNKSKLEKFEEKKEEEIFTDVNSKPKEECNANKIDKKDIEKNKTFENDKNLEDDEKKIRAENLKRSNPFFRVGNEEEFKLRRFLQEIEEINIYAKRDFYYC